MGAGDRVRVPADGVVFRRATVRRRRAPAGQRSGAHIGLLLQLAALLQLAGMRRMELSGSARSPARLLGGGLDNGTPPEGWEMR